MLDISKSGGYCGKCERLVEFFSPIDKLCEDCWTNQEIAESHTIDNSPEIFGWRTD